MIPIVDLARWAGMAAGVTSASTSERLRAAAAAGTLSDADAQTLEDAFTLITDLRVEHQVEQLRAGEEPDDFVNPATLSGLTRSTSERRSAPSPRSRSASRPSSRWACDEASPLGTLLL